MIERLSEDLMAVLRKKFMSGTAGELATHIGDFVLNFSTAEMWITNALYWILGITDSARLEHLTKGMDARVKCERLRQAAKAYCQLGPHLSAGLAIFEEDCIPTRNRIAHTWPYLNPATRIIQFSSLANLPDLEATKPPPTLAKTHGIHIDDLFCQGMWLNKFGSDIHSALMQAKRGEHLEITDERKRPLSEGRSGSPKKAGRAKSRKRATKQPPSREG